MRFQFTVPASDFNLPCPRGPISIYYINVTDHDIVINNLSDFNLPFKHNISVYRPDFQFTVAQDLNLLKSNNRKLVTEIQGFPESLRKNYYFDLVAQGLLFRV